jgi:hypothetical protein
MHFQVVLDGVRRRQAMREGFVALDAEWEVERLEGDEVADFCVDGATAEPSGGDFQAMANRSGRGDE